MHLNDTLVAPIFDSSQNETSRSVWVPPGQWQDAWDGSLVTGPQTMTVTQPYERQPMWHRRGGLLVTVDDPGTRVEQQDWSHLTVQAFPATDGMFLANPDGWNDGSADGAAVVSSSHRVVYDRGSTKKGTGRTHIEMRSSADGTCSFAIRGDTPSAATTERAWTIRIHLLPGQQATLLGVDGVAHDASVHGDVHGDVHDASVHGASVHGAALLARNIPPSIAFIRHIAPVRSAADVASFFPFQGSGTAPAEKAGSVAEVHLAAGIGPRDVVVRITQSCGDYFNPCGG